ncbi:MAG: hypothetical protein M1834_000545 [Cirrosporium novae-zelandiae]|nr:MAG: hypothetical protein M1834_000545 [Cirrosporium novae-zelandiae]
MSATKKNLSADAVWFVTGCSSGIGAALATTIANSGHRLVATARNPDTLSFLPSSPNILKLRLDVTSLSQIKAAIAATISAFGRLDVLVNNAAYGVLSDFEAIPLAQAEAQFATNFWGPLNLTKEALRVFREDNPKGEGGTVVQVTSLGGWMGFPGGSVYSASKFALEGMTECISREMNPEWNIEMLIVEPGNMKSAFAGNSVVLLRHPAYEGDERCPYNTLVKFLGDPKARETFVEPVKVARVIFKVVARKGDKPLPLRLPMEETVLQMMRTDMEGIEKDFKEWEDVIKSVTSDGVEKDWSFIR